MVRRCGETASAQGVHEHVEDLTVEAHVVHLIVLPQLPLQIVVEHVDSDDYHANDLSALANDLVDDDVSFNH